MAVSGRNILAERNLESDEDLMGLVKSGGRQGLSVLMRRYANSLLTFLRRMTGDHHRSEELFQDVFLTVWVQRQEYEHPRPFRSWLFGIAANKCQTDMRSRVRRRETIDVEQVTSAAQIDHSPHEAVVATETATLVEQAVLELPDVQRQIVVLRVWNGLSYQMISQIVCRQESTVRSHMFQAVKTMRKYLEPRLRVGD